MKRLPLLLAVSGVANLLLAAVWLTSQPSSAVPATASPARPTTTASSASESVASPSPVADWSTLTAGLGDTPDDDAALVARLRAAEFSPELIRIIMTRRIRDRYIEREAALIANQPPVEYWSRSSLASGHTTSEVRTELRRLRREQDALLDNLLGSEAEPALEKRMRENRFGPMPRELAQQLQDIRSDYSDLEREIRAGGMMLPSDREQLELLAAARDADIAALLTPEQLTAYQLRSGPTGQRLRGTLAEFKPSEAEYIALHALQAEFDAEWGTSSMGLPMDQRRARSDAQKALDQRIANTLGPERYAEYELKTEGSYRITKQLTDRLSLPPENALAAVRMRKEIQDASNALNRDGSLSPESRAAARIALQQRARTELDPLLTTAGLAAYENSGAGHWLRMLVPPTPPSGGN